MMHRHLVALLATTGWYVYVANQPIAPSTQHIIVFHDNCFPATYCDLRVSLVTWLLIVLQISTSALVTTLCG